MPASFDLHNHTCWSYDAFTDPEQVFIAARERGVAVISITDHHVFDATEDVVAVAERFPDVRWIPGVEFSGATEFGPVDILAYGLPVDRPEPLASLLDECHEMQRQRGRGIAAAARSLGFDYSDEDREQLLETYRPRRVLEVQGATHVRNETQREYFVARGFAKDDAAAGELMSAIFRTGLVAPYPPAARIRDAVHAVGGLLAIAHPYGYFKGFDMDRVEALLAETGADGIECAHPAVPVEFTWKYRAFCEERGLLSTGGSDFHNGEDMARGLGGHVGEDRWLDELLERVKTP